MVGIFVEGFFFWSVFFVYSVSCLYADPFPFNSSVLVKNNDLKPVYRSEYTEIWECKDKTDCHVVRISLSSIWLIFYKEEEIFLFAFFLGGFDHPIPSFFLLSPW